MRTPSFPTCIDARFTSAGTARLCQAHVACHWIATALMFFASYACLEEKRLSAGGAGVSARLTSMPRGRLQWECPKRSHGG